MRPRIARTLLLSARLRQNHPSHELEPRGTDFQSLAHQPVACVKSILKQPPQQGFILRKGDHTMRMSLEEEYGFTPKPAGATAISVTVTIAVRSLIGCRTFPDRLGAA